MLYESFQNFGYHNVIFGVSLNFSRVGQSPRALLLYTAHAHARVFYFFNRFFVHAASSFFGIEGDIASMKTALKMLWNCAWKTALMCSSCHIIFPVENTDATNTSFILSTKCFLLYDAAYITEGQTKYFNVFCFDIQGISLARMPHFPLNVGSVITSFRSTSHVSS